MNASQQPASPNQNALGGVVRRQFAPYADQAMQNAAPNSTPGQYAAQAQPQATTAAPPAQTVTPSYTPTQGQPQAGQNPFSAWADAAKNPGNLQPRDAVCLLMSPFMAMMPNVNLPAEAPEWLRNSPFFKR